MDQSMILLFGVGGYGKGKQTVKVYQLEDGSYLSACTRIYNSFLGSETDEVEIALEAETVADFVRKAEELGVFEWESKYFGKRLDGSDWELVIEIGDRPRLKCRGLSDQPGTFSEFMELLKPLGLK